MKNSGRQTRCIVQMTKLKCYMYIIFHFKQIYRHCNAKNAKTKNFLSLFHIFLQTVSYMYGEVRKFFQTDKPSFANKAVLIKAKVLNFNYLIFSRVKIYSAHISVNINFICDSSFDSFLSCCLLARAWSYLYSPQYFVLAKLGSRSVWISRGQMDFNPAYELLQCTKTGSRNKSTPTDVASLLFLQ